ncbi:DNA-directed RNA polymerase subunit K [Candidatus Woesearchaeota archaeon]|nr:DNA-directed RNA polymerase subunit K [Candidatus Woesearchaeota archaeon]
MTNEKPSYTKFELARLIGSRALQISSGAPILIKLSEENLEKIRFNSIEIAKLELEKDLLPITIKRPLPKEEALQEQVEAV